MNNSHIYTVNIAPGLRYDCDLTSEPAPSLGDEVIIQLDRRQDNGVVESIRQPTVSKSEKDKPRGESASKGSCESGRQAQRKGRGGRPGRRENELKSGRILRLVNAADRDRIREKASREVSMLRTAVRKIKEHNLQMKILNCHYTFDRSMVFFQFVAEGRVDFRNLVKDLSGALQARVELRQIGVRDEAAMVGGIGCCGRPFCCATVLNGFPAVNVKTAKEQRLSLNPSSVSGSCGRLKCCLRYELEGYRELNKTMPRINSRCQTRDGCGKIIDCNLLTRNARVRLDGESGRCIDAAVDDLMFD